MTTASTGGQNSGRKIVVSARVKPSGMTAVRNLSASSGSGRSSSGLEPSAAASTPSGRSFFSTRKRTLSGLTLRSMSAETASAIAA